MTDTYWTLCSSSCSRDALLLDTPLSCSSCSITLVSWSHLLLLVRGREGKVKGEKREREGDEKGERKKGRGREGREERETEEEQKRMGGEQEEERGRERKEKGEGVKKECVKWLYYLSISNLTSLSLSCCAIFPCSLTSSSSHRAWPSEWRHSTFSLAMEILTHMYKTHTRQSMCTSISLLYQCPIYRKSAWSM